MINRISGNREIFCFNLNFVKKKRKKRKEIPAPLFATFQFVYWQQSPTFKKNYCLTFHTAFTAFLGTMQWKRKHLLSLVMTQFWACAFLMSLWSATGFIGSFPEGTWCQCCRISFSLWQMWQKTLAASDQFWPPGNNKSQGFPLESCLEALHGNEEWR